MFVPPVWPPVPLRWPPTSLHPPTTQFTWLLNATCSYRPHGHPYRFVGHPHRFTCQPRGSPDYSVPHVRTARMAIRTASLATRVALLAKRAAHLATQCHMFVPPAWPSVPLVGHPRRLTCQPRGSPVCSMPHVRTARMAIRTASLATIIA